MRVKDLKDIINAFPDSMDECEIILQKDAEGNEYSPMSDAVEVGIYVAESTWSGQVYNPNSSAEDNGMYDEEWEKLKDDKSKQCIVFWPIN
jgi:hypothetical protein